MNESGPTEFDLVDWIRQRPQEFPPEIVKAAGDDCAVVRPPPDSSLALSSDLLVEDIHFRRRWISPRLLGRKALVVNLSDLAAVGAKPRACLLNLATPGDLDPGYFHGFMEGFLQTAARWGSPLIGGDLSRSEKIVVSVTVVGDLEGHPAVFRSTARPGDQILLVGELGLARLGLADLERRDPPDLWKLEEDSLARYSEDEFSLRCLARHLAPEPLVREGVWLARNRLVNSMIDVSDGLSSDLLHIARESRLEAEIDIEKLPLPEARAGGMDPLEAALNGGEDYALLATASRPQLERIERDYPAQLSPLRVIGNLSAGTPAVYLRQSDMRRRCRPGGFDHFK